MPGRFDAVIPWTRHEIRYHTQRSIIIHTCAEREREREGGGGSWALSFYQRFYTNHSLADISPDVRLSFPPGVVSPYPLYQVLRRLSYLQQLLTSVHKAASAACKVVFLTRHERRSVKLDTSALPVNYCRQSTMLGTLNRKARTTLGNARGTRRDGNTVWQAEQQHKLNSVN